MLFLIKKWGIYSFFVICLPQETQRHINSTISSLQGEFVCVLAWGRGGRGGGKDMSTDEMGEKQINENFMKIFKRRNKINWMMKK